MSVLYVTSIERHALEIGEQRGIQRGIEIGEQRRRRSTLLESLELMLKMKFGEAGLTLRPEIREMEDLAVLETIRDSIPDAASLEVVRQIYRSVPPSDEAPGAPA